MSDMTPWHIVSEVFGWAYVICWGLVAYPQLYLNYKLKSVEGFKLDYPFLNLSGFAFYSISTGVGYFDKELPYHNYGLGTVQCLVFHYIRIHDLVFAFHNLFVNILLNTQSLIYKRGANKLSKFAIVFAILTWLTAGIIALITEVFDWVPISGAFNILLIVGYLKMAITLTKYVPLVFWNYKRKSTSGFSIYSILFDLLGGIFSISQLFIDFGEKLTETLNPIKLGLGVIVIFYDIIIIYQHYVLYRKTKPTQISHGAPGYYIKMENDESSDHRTDTLRHKPYSSSLSDY